MQDKRLVSLWLIVTCTRSQNCADHSLEKSQYRSSDRLLGNDILHGLILGRTLKQWGSHEPKAQPLRDNTEGRVTLAFATMKATIQHPAPIDRRHLQAGIQEAQAEWKDRQAKASNKPGNVTERPRQRLTEPAHWLQLADPEGHSWRGVTAGEVLQDLGPAIGVKRRKYATRVLGPPQTQHPTVAPGGERRQGRPRPNDQIGSRG